MHEGLWKSQGRTLLTLKILQHKPILANNGLPHHNLLLPRGSLLLAI